MTRQQFVWIACVLLCACSGQEKLPYSDNNCKLVPPFVGRLGFDTKRSYFSTSEKRTMGLVLLQASPGGNLAAGNDKRFQDSSWIMAGGLSSIQLDNRGNIFTVPVPFINVLNNKMADQNTVYRVNGQTGKMEPFVRLPLPDSSSADNPYGILSLVYLCESGSLYVSTVAGSTRSRENGVLYQVDAVSGQTGDKLTGIDILGMGIAYTTGERRLFMGKARTSDVWSVVLDKKGRFASKPQFEFSVSGLGPRGDDKVRRIKTDKNGDLEVYGTAFNFNLIAPTEKQETVYRFSYNEAAKKWLPQ
jgi:hypothetical protein